jgi:mannose-6-phosphate isomerase-like protein (cupin superfamily)
MSAAEPTRYRFEGRSGYIVHPARSGASQRWLAIGHTASAAPWADPGIHLHRDSEEYDLLLRGTLRILVAGALLTLRPKEMLMVEPGVPHAIVGGEGSIEHFGLRAPVLDDKAVLGEIPPELPQSVEETARELRGDWGARIPLPAKVNQNRWLVGYGAARFPSAHLVLAYLNLPTVESASAGLGTRHRLHYHTRSWEYYVVLRGRRRLQVGEELVELGSGEILEVPPRVPHTLRGQQDPYEGLTLRVPVLTHSDKVEC